MVYLFSYQFQRFFLCLPQCPIGFISLGSLQKMIDLAIVCNASVDPKHPPARSPHVVWSGVVGVWGGRVLGVEGGGFWGPRVGGGVDAGGLWG